MKGSSMLQRVLRMAAIVLMLGLLPWTAAVQTGVQAASPEPGPDQPQGWINFGEPVSPAAASLTLSASKASAIDLRAAIPGAWAGTRSLTGAQYAVLANDGLVTGHEPGLPDLPVLRQDVEIPFGASYSLEVTQVQSREASLAQLGLPQRYNPAQPSQPKCGDAIEPCQPDAKVYAEKAYYPAETVRVVNEYVVRGHRVITLEIWPVAYNPAAGSLRLVSDIQVRIHLQGSDLALTRAMAERYASPAFEKTLANTLVNYNQGAGESALTTGEGYLMIVADAYDTADLAAFVALKQSQGFVVTKVKQSEISNGGTAAGIQAFIQNAYDNWALPPSFVLFVGDTDTIPNWPFKSSGETSYKTDLYHVTMDGTNDFVPDIYRGRFPVRSTAQLTNMVNNALWYDATSGEEDWVKKAAFLATDDGGNYDVAEGTHNYVINTYTLGLGYTGIFPLNPQAGGDKLYAITHNADTTDVLASINDDRVMVVYSGHGSQTSWAGPSVSQDNVRNLTGVLSAYVVGHACVTADFNTTESFADTWVIQPNKGALVYVGASDNSYWDEDDILERVIFDTLYTAPVIDVPSINEMLYAGLAAVQSGIPSSAQYYWEEYNLFGDPSTTVVLGPKSPDFTLTVNPDRVGICNAGGTASTVQVGSINDYVTPVALSLTGVPGGVAHAFDPATVTPAGTSTLTLTNDGSAAAGSYPLVVQGVSGDLTHTADLTLDVFTQTPLAPTLLTPADGAMNQPAMPTLTWEAAEQAGSYNLQVARDAAFTEIVVDQVGIINPYITLTTELLTGTKYYWRVQAVSACGTGEYSEAFDFTTTPAPGDCSPGYSPVVLHQVDFEDGNGGWTDASIGSYHWALSTVQSHSPTHSQLGVDVGSAADQRLVSPAVILPAAGQEPLSFTYWNRYTFEGTSSCYDGGLLEISTNGGTTWTQVPAARLLTQPYNGTISSGYNNPLAGLPGWCFANTTWTRSVVDLNSYAGQTVQFRFRLGTDSSVSAEGWYIDDALIKSCVVDSPQYGVTLSPAADEKLGEPGSAVDYTLTLTNTGNVEDTFTFSAADNVWGVTLPADVTLGAGASTQVTVSVSVPEDALGSDSLTVTATSLADGMQSDSSSLTTTAILRALEISGTEVEAAGLPGETIDFTLSVTNNGNVDDILHFSTTSLWTVALPADLALAAGASAPVTVSVTIPADAPDGSVEVAEILAQIVGHEDVSDAVSVTVTVLYRHLFLPTLIK